MAKLNAIKFMAAANKLKSRKSVRDIKPAAGKTVRGAFNVRQMEREDAPSVEPLAEDSVNESANFKVDRIEPDTQNYDEQDYQNAKPEPEIAVNPVNSNNTNSMNDDFTPEEQDLIEEYITPALKEDLPPKETVKVNFAKFVQLVGNRDFKDVIDNNSNEDIIISSNLLTELAGANDSRGEKRIPLVFLVGIAIGVVLTYILFST